MSARGLLQVLLYAEPINSKNSSTIIYEFDDITEGILNVDISFGNEIYEGPWQQIDTGQFTIVSRNPALDPKVNPKLNFNSVITFNDTRTGEFFRGYVTDVNVEYQRNDDPIITITGTDIFGILQRTVVDKEMYDNLMALSTGPTWDGVSLEDFCDKLGGAIGNFQDKYLNTESMNNSPTGIGFYTSYLPGIASLTGSEQKEVFLLGRSNSKYIPQIGETLLEVINKYCQTDLRYVSRKTYIDMEFIDIYPQPKYNGYFWTPQQDPALQYPYYTFSSDPADNAPYQSITINNGFNRLTNQIDLENEYRTLDGTEIVSIQNNYGPFIPAQSIEDYAVSKASLPTIFAPSKVNLTNAASRYTRDIFQVVGFPTEEIQQITFDNSRYALIENNSSYSPYNLNEFVRIKHQLNENEIIDRFYNIAGIQHRISPDEWTMSFTLKPSMEEIVFNYQGYKPRIQMNSLTGDTNFNFTATIVDYPIENIASVLWCLNAPDANEGVYYYPSTVVPPIQRYKDGLPRTGLTQTWNFDDDGILAPYSFDVFNDPPVDNRFGGYGPGIWTVYAYIILRNGFVIIAEETLTVGTPVVEADFGWSQNLTNNFGQVQFTDTSVNHETGEPDSYFWDFGDGTTSNLRNPLKTYVPVTNENSYSVSLTVFAYGPGGTKIYNTKTQTVTLTQPTMVADFTSDVNYQVVTFTNTSTNVGFEEPDAYLWDFGDGTTSSEKNPIHTFPVVDVNTPQSFNVTLTTRNIWEQTATVTKTITTTALNKSGTFPARYIKFKIDAYLKPGTITSAPGDLFAITPVMSNLKAITSNTGANLVYLKPLVGFNDNSTPTMRWFATNGGAVQSSRGWEYFLTRDPEGLDPINYGDGPASQINFLGIEVPYKTVRWELVIDMGESVQLINDIIMRFEDLFVLSGSFAGLHVESFYPKISVELASVIGGITPNPAGVFGPGSRDGDWVNIGYFKLDGGRMDPTKPSGQRTNATKTMFKMRPLPLNIPYFNYTFNDKVVSFTSVETADSYAWTFGDGTTSTLKDPVKTYASYGTYTVTLAVTNGGVVTRTTTEPVIVQAPII